METINVQPFLSIAERLNGLLSDVYQKIEEHEQKLKVLLGPSMPENVQQAADHEEDFKVQSNGKSSTHEDSESTQQAAESEEDVNVRSNGKSTSLEDSEKKQDAAESEEDVKVLYNGKCYSPEDSDIKQHAADSKEDANVRSNGKSSSPEDSESTQQAAESEEDVNVRSNGKSIPPEDSESTQQAAESEEDVNVRSNGQSTSLEDSDKRQEAAECEEEVKVLHNDRRQGKFSSPEDSATKQHAADSKEDANVRPYRKSYCPEDSESTQQAAESEEDVNVRSNVTKNFLDKVNIKGHHYLWIALSIITLLPGAYGSSDPVRFYTQIGQPVNLPAGAKVEDSVYWSRSPPHNSTDYYTLYTSDKFGKSLRSDGCEGYDFGLNHSMFIASAQPCHAGTYTVEVIGVDSRTMTMILIVDDVAENSTERAKENETLLYSTPTTASNAESKSINTVVSIIICCAIIIVVAGIYLIWKCKRNCFGNKAVAGGNSSDVIYDQVRRGDDVEAT